MLVGDVSNNTSNQVTIVRAHWVGLTYWLCRCPFVGCVCAISSIIVEQSLHGFVLVLVKTICSLAC